jgi:HSP20 family protein
MRLVKYSPLKDLWDLEERVNRTFRDMVPRHLFHEEEFTGGWEPLVDVYETDKGFVLKAELPGMKEEDVHVNIEGNILTFTGERKREEEITKEHYHRTERYYGSFCRSFAIPESVDREHIKATFRSGVMKLDLPKKEEVKPKEIKIEVEK